jgi:hypothetical protein
MTSCSCSERPRPALHQFQNALLVARFIWHGELSCAVPFPRGGKVNILERFRKASQVFAASSVTRRLG